MNCKRCSKELTGQQTSFCSSRCSRLELKRLYRLRNREKLNAYNRRYKSLGLSPLHKERKEKIIKSFDGQCYRCGSSENLNVHHWKPLRMGGTNETKNLFVFCSSCHQRFHQYFDNNFWLIIDQKTKDILTNKNSTT